ncbi:tetratricopeptide repeat protein [Luteimonas vadosa]
MARRAAVDGASGEQDVPVARHESASIAVLPFDFIGQDSGDAYIADGFTDEIIADLAKISSLRVISRTSSMQLKAKGLSIGDIAARLDVCYLLEGSVRRHCGEIRASAQLIEADRERRVWSEKFAGTVSEVFDIQARIAREAAAAMKLRLTAEDESRLAHRGISEWPAWLAALQARQASLRWTRDGIDEAIGLLEDALTKAGDEAQLHAVLGKTHLHCREAGLDLSERPLVEARRCAERAFAADPDGAHGHELQGWLHYSQGEIQSAVENLKSAYARQGSNPDTLGLLCYCYLISGQVSVARALMPQVLAMDPLTQAYQALPAWADVLEGRHRDAVSVYRRLLDREPQSPLLRLFLVWILSINGLTDEVQSTVDGYADSDRDSLSAKVARCFAAACRGSRPQIELSVTDRAFANANDLYPRMLAQAHALAGEPAPAIEWLTLAVSRGFINYPYLSTHDPLLTRLQEEASYRDLLQVVHRRWVDFVV